MRTVGLGIQSFEDVRSNNQFYVDKTEFISAWYRGNDSVTLLTRPRRFGKTLTIDMLNCFFSTEYAGREDLFEGLAVSRDPQMMKLQGTVPTIRISLSGVKAESFDGFLVGLAGRMARVLRHYEYLLKADVMTEKEKDVFQQMSDTFPLIPDRRKEKKEYSEYVYRLTHLLQSLSFWLWRYHGKKVFIFMDEYDTPIQSAYLNHYYDDAIVLLRELFSETFKENDSLRRAVITGITRIAKESLFSEMNNLAVCSVISGGYDSIFGFTGGEMDEVLEEYALTDKKEEMRFWYDGFTVGRQEGLYNPWSVLNYLAHPGDLPTDYWAQSGGLGLVDYLIRHGGEALREGFERLLNGEMIERKIREDLVFPRLDKDENAVWSLLIAAGYVRPVACFSGNGSAERSKCPDETEESRNRVIPGLSVRMPGKTGMVLTNYEARVCLSDMVTGWFASRSGNYMELFACALLAGDLWEMNAQMGKAVLLCASSFDSGVKPSRGAVQPENFFHALTLGMLTCLSETHRITSNRESGFGRYDVCIEPRDPGQALPACILEFKVFTRREGDRTLEDAARRARTQIDALHYDAEMHERGIPADRIRKYGFGFKGKEVLIVQ